MDRAAGIVPPSVKDPRGAAFASLMQRALSDVDFHQLLIERIDTVDAALLPFLIRDFSIEEFVEPGMSEAVIRDLLKASFELHALKGYISGVRRGLMMLGMRVVWKQWFAATPKGAAGTHTATVFISRSLFDGQAMLIDERVQRAALRMIEGMKRYSQDVAFQLGLALEGRLQVAAAARSLAVAPAHGSAGPQSTIGRTLGIASHARALAVSRSAGEASPPNRPLIETGVAMAGRTISIINIRMEATAA